jgi:hypothetical protein
MPASLPRVDAFLLPRTHRRVRALAVAAIIITAAEAGAQVQAGRILGTVHDPSKAVVPGATVVVTNIATNVSQSVTTTNAGDYAVTALEPGVYRVSASAPGFETLVKTAVDVQVDASVRVNFDLKLGEVETQVTVGAATPLLNTESGTLGQVITNRRAPAGHGQRPAHPAGVHQRHHDQRYTRPHGDLPAGWVRCHRATSGRHLHPDVD